MKKKLPVDRKQVNPFQSTDAANSFDILYQRYLDTVYRRGSAALDKTSDPTFKQFMADLTELKLRTTR
ncbi:hypothetical protein GCM10028805_42820 [Spirosoma harenae]